LKFKSHGHRRRGWKLSLGSECDCRSRHSILRRSSHQWRWFGRRRLDPLRLLPLYMPTACGDLAAGNNGAACFEFETIGDRTSYSITCLPISDDDDGPARTCGEMRGAGHEETTANDDKIDVCTNGEPFWPCHLVMGGFHWR